MYTQELFLQDVKAEAEALRQHATAEEVARLNHRTLDATKTSGCIYGQLTGHCYSPRAAELIKKCTPRYFEADAIVGYEGQPRQIEDIIYNANGTCVEDFIYNRVNLYSLNTHFSAIEAYIGWNLANNGDLIDYIQGKTDTLTL